MKSDWDKFQQGGFKRVGVRKFQRLVAATSNFEKGIAKACI